MKLFFIVIIVFIYAAGPFKICAQTPSGASKTGTVVKGSANKSPSKTNSFNISKVDFDNFTFPDFGRIEQIFTLKNGNFESKDGFPKYKLRKTYYFDLTGDKIDEAISHIIATGCQMGCDTSNLFYIHTTENNQPKLLWKIATGGDTMGGLKAAYFKNNEITMEVFGDCTLENLVIKPQIDLTKNATLKTTSFTRFVFELTDKGFIQTERILLPLTSNKIFGDYRSRINFGELD